MSLVLYLTMMMIDCLHEVVESRGFVWPVHITHTGQNGWRLSYSKKAFDDDPGATEEKSGPDEPALPLVITFRDATGRLAAWHLDFSLKDGKFSRTEVESA